MVERFPNHLMHLAMKRPERRIIFKFRPHWHRILEIADHPFEMPVSLIHARHADQQIILLGIPVQQREKC